MQRGNEVYGDSSSAQPHSCPWIQTPASSFHLVPTACQIPIHSHPLMMFLPFASQHGHLQSRTLPRILTQRAEATELLGRDECVCGGGASNWHRLPAKHTSKPHHTPLRTPILHVPHLLQLPPSSAHSSRFTSKAMASVTSLLSPLTRKKVVHCCEVCLHAPHSAPSSGDGSETHLMMEGGLLPHFLWKQPAQGSTAPSRLG